MPPGRPPYTQAAAVMVCQRSGSLLLWQTHQDAVGLDPLSCDRFQHVYPAMRMPLSAATCVQRPCLARTPSPLQVFPDKPRLTRGAEAGHDKKQAKAKDGIG
jgi:hypothetical protein